MASAVDSHLSTPSPPGACCAFPGVVLTISQMGEGTLRRTWELSEVTDWTPRFTLRFAMEGLVLQQEIRPPHRWTHHIFSNDCLIMLM
uniref:Uncharacterized protein n=1 Tax=Apteryx owenii TaxID=8824 RepID=A0A8B9PMH4_APTOW